MAIAHLSPPVSASAHEQLPLGCSLPEGLTQYSEIERKVYSNGAEHLYGINEETGKREHISFQKVANVYGYEVGQQTDQIGANDGPDVSSVGYRESLRADLAAARAQLARLEKPVPPLGKREKVLQHVRGFMGSMALAGSAIVAEVKDTLSWNTAEDPLAQPDGTPDNRDRVSEDFAASVMHTLKEFGMPDEVLQQIPVSYFYKESDPGRTTNGTPDVVKKWIAENPDALMRIKNANSRTKAPEPGQDPVPEPVSISRNSDIDDKKLAKLATQLSSFNRVKKPKSQKHTWRSRLAFWKKGDRTKALTPLAGYTQIENSIDGFEPDPNYVPRMTPERMSKRLAIAGLGALATLTASYAAAKGFNIGGGNKSTHGVENATLVNPLKGLDLKDVLQLATGKAAKAAEHQDALRDIHEAWKGSVAPGDGPTYVIQDMLGQHGIHLSPAQLHDVYSQHEGFFRSLGDTYTLPNGEVGFRGAGNVTIPHDVMQQMINDAKELAK